MNSTTPAKAKKSPRKSTAEKKMTKTSAAKILDETHEGPNLFFLSLAGAFVLGSALLTLSHNGKTKILGRFIGLLVPSLLSLSFASKASYPPNQVLDVVKH